MEDDRGAREISNEREQLQQMRELNTRGNMLPSKRSGARFAIGNCKELNIIIFKGDMDGSSEASSDSVIKL